MIMERGCAHAVLGCSQSCAPLVSSGPAVYGATSLPPAVSAGLSYASNNSLNGM